VRPDLTISYPISLVSDRRDDIAAEATDVPSWASLEV
jgi:hypothetical protein